MPRFGSKYAKVTRSPEQNAPFEIFDSVLINACSSYMTTEQNSKETVFYRFTVF